MVPIKRTYTRRAKDSLLVNGMRTLSDGKDSFSKENVYIGIKYENPIINSNSGYQRPPLVDKNLNADEKNDPFEKLLKSPLHQSVNFKPLTFWEKKVQDFDKKQKPKKKVDLYDFSGGSDESFTTKKCKKKKKKGLKKIQQKKCWKTDFYAFKGPLPKPRGSDQKKITDKDVLLVRKRIQMHRERVALSKTQEKFIFSSDISLKGITSTPCKTILQNSLAKNFNFVSPITSLPCVTLQHGAHLEENFTSNEILSKKNGIKTGDKCEEKENSFNDIKTDIILTPINNCKQRQKSKCVIDFPMDLIEYKKESNCDLSLNVSTKGTEDTNKTLLDSFLVLKKKDTSHRLSETCIQVDEQKTFLIESMTSSEGIGNNLGERVSSKCSGFNESDIYKTCDFKKLEVLHKAKFRNSENLEFSGLDFLGFKDRRFHTDPKYSDGFLEYVKKFERMCHNSTKHSSYSVVDNCKSSRSFDRDSNTGTNLEPEDTENISVEKGSSEKYCNNSACDALTLKLTEQKSELSNVSSKGIEDTNNTSLHNFLVLQKKDTSNHLSETCIVVDEKKSSVIESMTSSEGIANNLGEHVSSNCSGFNESDIYKNYDPEKLEVLHKAAFRNSEHSEFSELGFIGFKNMRFRIEPKYSDGFLEDIKKCERMCHNSTKHSSYSVVDNCKSSRSFDCNSITDTNLGPGDSENISNEKDGSEKSCNNSACDALTLTLKPIEQNSDTFQGKKSSNKSSCNSSSTLSSGSNSHKPSSEGNKFSSSMVNVPEKPYVITSIPVDNNLSEQMYNSVNSEHKEMYTHNNITIRQKRTKFKGYYSCISDEQPTSGSININETDSLNVFDNKKITENCKKNEKRAVDSNISSVTSLRTKKTNTVMNTSKNNCQILDSQNKSEEGERDVSESCVNVTKNFKHNSFLQNITLVPEKRCKKSKSNSRQYFSNEVLPKVLVNKNLRCKKINDDFMSSEPLRLGEEQNIQKPHVLNILSPLELSFTPTVSNSQVVSDVNDTAFQLPLFKSPSAVQPSLVESSFKISQAISKKDPRSSRLTRKKASLYTKQLNSICESFGTAGFDKDDTVLPMNESVIQPIALKPGKKWLRSLSVLNQVKRRNITIQDELRITPKQKGMRYLAGVEEVLSMQRDLQDTLMENSILQYNENKSMNISLMSSTKISFKSRYSVIPLPKMGSLNSQPSLLQTAYFAENDTLNLTCHGIHVSPILNKDKNGSFHMDEQTEGIIPPNLSVTPKDVVLMRCCQEKPLPFNQCFNESTLLNCQKIGEGVYGEVFMYDTKEGGKSVIKIIPIEGSVIVNDETQKKYSEILPEIIIAMELSNLRNGQGNRTSGFSELKRCWCVYGAYPSYLIDLWKSYDLERGSENDTPTCFQEDQLYIVLELANGGKDLESFVFNSAEQALSILHQIAFSLAVAEQTLEFEHRDLHWGNILIARTDKKFMTFELNGSQHQVSTKGVQVSIIDFTLSRITYDNCIFCIDLAMDPGLFTSCGDYQFEIYRMMQRKVENNWSVFEPATNIFWLHYVIDKMISMGRYRRTNTKVHTSAIKTLSSLRDRMLTYSSATEFVKTELF